MNKQIHKIVGLCLLPITLVLIGLFYAGYNYSFEIDDICITNIEKESKELKLTVDYFTSAKVIKNIKYAKVDNQLIIRLYGGWIYPWDKGITEFSIGIASDLYNQVVIKGKKTKKIILSE